MFGDFFIEWEELKDTAISGSITGWDAIRFQRIFRFLAFSFRKFCQIKNLDEKTIAQSLVPIFPLNILVTLLEQTFGNQKTQDLIELFSRKALDRSFFDIQYQPLIRIGERVACPVHIVAHSNLLRNSMQTTKFRFDAEGRNSGMARALEAAFSEQRVLHGRDISFSHGKSRGDIDFLAIYEDELFIFECKQSLGPTSIAELRTSLDHIEKAERQLTLIKELFKEAAFRAQVSKKCQLDLARFSDPITCILTGNRMFPGLSKGGHPVRTIYELINVIKSGTIRVRDEVYNLWKCPASGRPNLKAHIDGGMLRDFHFDSMEPFIDKFRLKNATLKFERWCLDVEKLEKNAAERFERITDQMLNDE